MLFVVFGTDRPGQPQVRQAARAAHRTHLRQPGLHPVRVWLGGPTLTEGSSEMNGTMLVVEAERLEDVRAFLADDPYVRAGVFQALEVRAWHCGLGDPRRSA
ncbi:MAG TPA: YciI family protein [Anaeromyxobacter sp.]|nr:YciI family protein [Anaeromyxobacter sp.]